MKPSLIVFFLILCASSSSLSAQENEYTPENALKISKTISEKNETFFLKYKKENDQLRKDIAKLYLAYFGEEWGGLAGSSWGNSDLLNPKPNAGPLTAVSPATSAADKAEIEENTRKSVAEDYDSRIKDLNEQLRDIKKQLRDMTAQREDERTVSAAVIDSINGVNTGLKGDLADAERTLKRALAEAKKNQSIIDCASAFYKGNETKRNDSQNVLEDARAKYTRYAEIGGRNTNRYDEEIREHLDFIFDTYETYDDLPVSIDCGDGIVVKDVISFMDARDHLNLATILAADPRHLINRYEGGPDQRTAAINADLIYHLSQVFSKQNNFSDLSMSKRIADKLPDLMQKVPNALSSSSELNPQNDTDDRIIDLYAKVAKAYEDKNYGDALGLYNRYRRVEGEINLADNHKVRAATMTAVGIILLFDLGNNKSAKGIPLEGTFLAKALNNQQREGVALLKKVMTFRDKAGSVYPRGSDVFEWQQRASYAMSKHYFPAGKLERQRSREVKRMTKGKKLKSNDKGETVNNLEVDQARPYRLVMTPSIYPYLPVQQGFFRNDGSRAIDLDGSGLEGSARLSYFKPGKAFEFGLDLGYSQQYFRLENNSIRLPPASMSLGTAFGGPFVSYAARNIEKQFHPVFSAGLSVRYDIDRKLRLNDNDANGNRRSILVTQLPFMDRMSYYAQVGIGFNRERFSLSKQRMIASTFRMFAFLPVFNKAIQINNDPTAFSGRYSQNFLDVGRQTIHLGFTYSKMIEVFKNGLWMTGDEMYFNNNRKQKMRLLQPLAINNAPRKRIDGKFTLMTTIQPNVDSLFVSSDSSYLNLNISSGWRIAYNLHFLGNNDGFFNQGTGMAWGGFPLYDFFLAGGVEQVSYRLSSEATYRSFRNLHGFAEGGFRIGVPGLMVYAGGGYNFKISNQAIYANGEGVLNQVLPAYAFLGIQVANTFTARVSSRAINIYGTGNALSLKNPVLQIGFGF